MSSLLYLFIPQLKLRLYRSKHFAIYFPAVNDLLLGTNFLSLFDPLRLQMWCSFQTEIRQISSYLIDPIVRVTVTSLSGKNWLLYLSSNLQLDFLNKFISPRRILLMHIRIDAVKYLRYHDKSTINPSQSRYETCIESCPVFPLTRSEFSLRPTLTTCLMMS